MSGDTPSAAAGQRKYAWYRDLTGYQWFVVAIASVGWMFDTMAQQLFNLARVPALRDLLGGHASSGEISLQAGYATMIFMIGWALGGVLFGVLGDRLGRAKTMMLTILCYTIFTGVSLLSTGVWDFNLDILKELESMGSRVVRQSHILSGLERSISNKFSGSSHTEVLAEALRCLLGVGMKVAIECTIMAADSGAIPIQKTIAVGGTHSKMGGGVDCAIVVWPSHFNNFFDFRVLEILAKPYRRDITE